VAARESRRAREARLACLSVMANYLVDTRLTSLFKKLYLASCMSNNRGVMTYLRTLMEKVISQAIRAINRTEARAICRSHISSFFGARV
jgi:hypothetical protein